MSSEVIAMQEPDNLTIPGPSLLSSGRYIHFGPFRIDRKSTRLNSSHLVISYAVFCLKKKKSETHIRSSSSLKRHPNLRRIPQEICCATHCNVETCQLHSSCRV